MRLRPHQFDDRPTPCVVPAVALYIWPKDDHNGAFAMSDIDRLNENYRVLYYEAASDDDMERILREQWTTAREVEARRAA